MNIQTKKTSVGEEIYSGTASAGKIFAIIGAIGTTLLALFLIIVGIYIINHRSHLKSVKGKVAEDSTCVTTQTGQNTQTTCNTKIIYTIDGKQYNETLDTGFTKYNKNDPITVYYSPKTPNKPEVNPLSKSVGWVLIVISLLMMIGSWFWLYLTEKYKVVAAAGGAGGLLNIATGGKL